MVRGGGQISYMWRRLIGGEFLTDVEPTVKIGNTFLSESPGVNSYMANLIGAVPIGGDDQYVPYISGGFGGIQMHTDVLTLLHTGETTPTSARQTKFGGNIGAGLIAFAGRVGFQADVRCFKTSMTDQVSSVEVNAPADQVTRAMLAGLEFWRGSVGVAFRW